MVAMLLVWARMTTQRQWRAWLTKELIARWVVNDRARRLRFTFGEDRNPEYRIAEDARVATDAPITMAVGLLTAVLNAVTSSASSGTSAAISPSRCSGTSSRCPSIW